MGTAVVDIDDALRRASNLAFGWHEMLDEMGPGGFRLALWQVHVSDEILALRELASAHPSRQPEIDLIVAQFEKFSALLNADLAAEQGGQ